MEVAGGNLFWINIAVYYLMLSPTLFSLCPVCLPCTRHTKWSSEFGSSSPRSCKTVLFRLQHHCMDYSMCSTTLSMITSSFFFTSMLMHFDSNITKLCIKHESSVDLEWSTREHSSMTCTWHELSNITEIVNKRTTCILNHVVVQCCRTTEQNLEYTIIFQFCLFIALFRCCLSNHSLHIIISNRLYLT